MGLESATYIKDLVDKNPVGNLDGVNDGDDHIRLIKDVLQKQFPNLGSAAVTSSASALSAVTSTNLVPSGSIMMWSGNINSLPSGWVLCNGGNSTPDMRNRFVVGAGSTYGINSTGGTNTCNVSGNTYNRTVSTSQMPSHSHTFPGDWRREWWRGDGDGGARYTNYNRDNTDPATVTSSSKGSNTGHRHVTNLSGGTNSNLPTYRAIAYIMKT